MEKKQKDTTPDITTGRGKAAEQSNQERNQGNQAGDTAADRAQSRPGNRAEGAYDKQEDDAARRPSGQEEQAGTP